MKKAFCRVIPALVLTCMLTSVAQALIINNFTTETNDRFANDDSFVLDGFDLSGLGRSSNSAWATLISDNVFISSNHKRPGIGSTVTTPPTIPTEIPSTARWPVDNGSVRATLGRRVKQPGFGGLHQYSILTNDIDDPTAFAASGLNGALAILVGRSATDWANQLQDIAIGTGALDLWSDDASAAGTTDDVLGTIYELGANDTAYESLVQGGDSGAPMFVTSGGEPGSIGWWATLMSLSTWSRQTTISVDFPTSETMTPRSAASYR